MNPPAADIDSGAVSAAGRANGAATSRLLIDCTYVFDHPAANSGIQRVVRSVARELPNVALGTEAVPVIIQRGEMLRVCSLGPVRLPEDARLLHRLLVGLEHLVHRLWWWHGRIERQWPFSRSRGAGRLLRSAFSSTAAVMMLPWRARVARSVPRRVERLRPMRGDRLLLLDSSWHPQLFPVREELKRQGIAIIAVVYDLVPLTHPQFCDDRLVDVFEQWFGWIARNADGYMCISQTVCGQLKRELGRRFGREAAERWCGHFYLGTELDRAADTADADRGLVRLLTSDPAIYLAVGTIEPRKNYAYVLDAFERLWARRLDVTLCIGGQIGWKCDTLVRRMRGHREFGRRLFLFHAANDCDLEFAYRHARALVLASHTEGFGLPLVEAMQRGLPAMASDIEVFREIGEKFVAYFDLEDPNSLASLVERYERDRRFPAARDLSEWHWISWRESTQQLLCNLAANGVRTYRPMLPR